MPSHLERVPKADLSLTLRCTDDRPFLNGRSLAFTLPSGQTITEGWHASGQVTARNVSYNGSVEIGFQATHTGNTGKPESFALNGRTCGVS